MIKGIIETLKRYSIWFIAIIILNVIFGFLLWIVDGKAFKYIFPIMVYSSALLYFAVVYIVYKRDLKRKEALEEFLDDCSIDFEKEIIGLFHSSEGEIVKTIGKIIRQHENTIKEQGQGIEEYEEYIEAWAHEIKTPLGLMTFVLDNRREELSPMVYNRLEYARSKMQEDIERMLYYARLKSDGNDYFFKELSLIELCEEVIEEYEILLREQTINVIEDLRDYHVFTDKKGIQFILRQIISNAIKYKDINKNNSLIHISSQMDEESIKLDIYDNGSGVKGYDLPFIFEKGFTGEVGEQRKNSTGMGLYLAKQVAKDLKVNLKVNEKYTEGFGISIVFPRVVDYF